LVIEQRFPRWNSYWVGLRHFHLWWAIHKEAVGWSVGGGSLKFGRKEKFSWEIEEFFL
jgi:hypothetical protein